MGSVAAMQDSDLQKIDLSHVPGDALATMTNVDRTALALHYLRGMTFQEIAATLRTTPQAAQTRAARALAKLRMRLAGRGVDLAPTAIVPGLKSERSEETHGDLLEDGVGGWG